MEELTLDILNIANDTNLEMYTIFKVIFKNGLSSFLTLTLILLLCILTIDMLNKI